MFKKVQLKFFAFTAGILLTLIIAVLVSINVIMKVVVERQSKVILKQIASSIEYDEKTSTFTYVDDKAPPKEHEIKPETPEIKESSTSASTSAEPETSESENTTTVDTTDAAHENEDTPQNGTSVSNEAATSANNTPSNQTVTQTAKPTTSAATTTVPEDTPTEAPTSAPNNADPESPQDETHPDHRGDEPPYWEDPMDYYDYNYPEYSDWVTWYYKNIPVPYNKDNNEAAEEEFTEQQSYDPEISGAVCLPLQSLGSPPILSDYTVLKSGEQIKRSTEPVPKSVGSIDFFVLMADKNGIYLASLNNDDLTEEAAQKYISRIMKSSSSSGMMDTLQFFTVEKNNGTLMVFTDKSAELDMLDQLTQTTTIIGILSFIALSVLTLFLSKKSIRPIKVAFEKQKQFISDASHELKTPLTIISANADVLSDEIGNNKWLNYIKSQTERMNILVNDLLNLTRLENNTSDFICCEFNLSKAIENTALPFECQAFEMQKSFDIDIQDGLTVNGSERHIKQMTAIFIDNALKYSNEGGTIRVTLKAQGDKKILSVFNTGQGVHDDEKEKIFERFYRSDDSRARSTGGYGLGLAIAKSVIDKHKFKLTVDNHEGESICFNVIM